MSNDIVADLKALSLHGMASAWPEVLGTARLKTLDHETVLHQLLKAESAQREVRSMAYQMRIARFQSHRDLAGFDFTQESGTNRGLATFRPLSAPQADQRSCLETIDKTCSSSLRSRPAPVSAATGARRAASIAFAAF